MCIISLRKRCRTSASDPSSGPHHCELPVPCSRYCMHDEADHCVDLKLIPIRSPSLMKPVLSDRAAA